MTSHRCATCPTLSGRYRLEQRFRERCRFEGTQGVDAFTKTDELDRHLELVDDRHDDAALGGRVEFRDDDAGQFRCFIKELGLRDRVLTRGAVEDEQRLRRLPRELALDDA